MKRIWVPLPLIAVTAFSVSGVQMGDLTQSR